MTAQLYTVTVTDLGTYRLTVAAASPKEAMSVAKTVLFEEAAQPPKGVTIVKRGFDATAELSADQPIRRFEVTGTYSLDLSLTVPAATAEEAQRHAQRLYRDEPLPFEHATGEERVRWLHAREVVS